MTTHEERLTAALAELGVDEMPTGLALLATHRGECRVCGRTHLRQAVAVVQAHCRDKVDAVHTCGPCHHAAGTGPVCTWEPPKG